MAGWTFLCEKAGDVSVDVPTCFWVQSQLDPHPGTLYLWQLKEGPESANLLREWRKTTKTENMIPGVCLDFVGAVIVLPKPIEAPVGSSWVPGRKVSRVAAHWHIPQLRWFPNFSRPWCSTTRRMWWGQEPYHQSQPWQMFVWFQIFKESGTTRRGI